MPRALLLLLLLSLPIPSWSADTVKLTIRRSAPGAALKAAQLAESEERTLQQTADRCERAVTLRAIEYTLVVRSEGEQIVIDARAVPTIEKTTRGPLASPVLILRAKTQHGESMKEFALDQSMASATWEQGGAFKETLRTDDLPDPKFWTSAELRCSRGSAYRAASVPADVTYVKRDDALLASAVAAVIAALRSPAGFATLSLYESESRMVLIGPDLLSAIRDDAALKKVESPQMFAIDPSGGKPRGMLRVKGDQEIALLGPVLRKYLGSKPPRIRAATAAELSHHWLNIGWDIEEPLLILDYGKHRVVLDYEGAAVRMIDELPPEP